MRRMGASPEKTTSAVPSNMAANPTGAYGWRVKRDYWVVLIMLVMALVVCAPMAYVLIS